VTELERAAMLEKASIDAGKEGLKALLILNGGACIALLSFLASTVGKQDLRGIETSLISGATNALILFATGAGLAVLTCLLSYVTNQFLSSYLRNGKQSLKLLKLGKCTNKLGLIASASSLLAFFIGLYAIWQNVSAHVL
jgi:hypothetical protein